MFLSTHCFFLRLLLLAAFLLWQAFQCFSQEMCKQTINLSTDGSCNWQAELLFYLLLSRGRDGGGHEIIRPSLVIFNIKKRNQESRFAHFG